MFKFLESVIAYSNELVETSRSTMTTVDDYSRWLNESYAIEYNTKCKYEYV